MGKYDNNPIIEARYDAYGRKTYWNLGYKGKGVRVGVIDDFTTPHGHQMASVAQYLAPDAEVVKLDMGANSYYAIIDRLKDALKLNLQILSISRSVDFDTKDMHDAIKACRDAGMTIFCSAGNTGDEYRDFVDIVRYPAAYPETVSVLCVDNSLAPSAMSSHGTTGTVTGFGQNVLVRNENGDELLVSGTSPTTAACAFISALYYEKFKAEHGKFPTPAQMDAFILLSCVDFGVYGRDNFTGYGFYTLDKDELERIKLMLVDRDGNGLSERVERIKQLVLCGTPYDMAERVVSRDYFIIAYERINGVDVPVYGGRKPM